MHMLFAQIDLREGHKARNHSLIATNQSHILMYQFQRSNMMPIYAMYSILRKYHDDADVNMNNRPHLKEKFTIANQIGQNILSIRNFNVFMECVDGGELMVSDVR